ncbi:MAG: damage-control phosphatase ARMT1 family protein [Candidatus Thorarchaeota archaeon]
MTLECAHCLLDRAINQVKLATDDPETQMNVTAAMLDFLSKSFNMEAVPSHIGTDRDLLVQEMTGRDPYEELKRISNVMALDILPELRHLMDESPDSGSRFRRATLIAAAANAIEFDVSGRDFDLEELRGIIERVESDLAIDQVDEFKSLCQGKKEVLYLLDNAGEIVLDMILISELKKLGLNVVAVVKGGPVLNDATMIDAREVGLDECADKVIHTGAAAIGVNLEKNSKEFLDVFHKAELIVAKGMGNFESLTELESHCPIVHILRTKCPPVAQYLGTALNQNVILVRKP